jgi:ribonuclease P protein component
MRSFTLRREERLRGQVAVSKLFTDHRVVVRFPFRIHYVSSTFGPEPFRVLFVASSRKYRKAPVRNRIKRVMRELYRLNRNLLTDAWPEDKPKIHLALIYTGQAEVNYNELLPAFRQLFTKLREHIEKPAD